MITPKVQATKLHMSMLDLINLYASRPPLLHIDAHNTGEITNTYESKNRSNKEFVHKMMHNYIEMNLPKPKTSY